MAPYLSILRRNVRRRNALVMVQMDTSVIDENFAQHTNKRVIKNAADS